MIQFTDQTHKFITEKLGINPTQLTINQGRQVINTIIDDLESKNAKIFELERQLANQKKMINESYGNSQKQDLFAKFERIANKQFLTFMMDISKLLEEIRNCNTVEEYIKLIKTLKMYVNNTEVAISKLAKDNGISFNYSKTEKALLEKVWEFTDPNVSPFKKDEYVDSILTLIEKQLEIDTKVTTQPITPKPVKEHNKSDCQCFMHQIKSLPEQKQKLFEKLLAESQNKVIPLFSAFVTKNHKAIEDAKSLTGMDKLVFNTLNYMVSQRTGDDKSKSESAKALLDSQKDVIDLLKSA